jgi:hypothetical protein
MWQVINFIVFQVTPAAPVIVGALLIVVGGAIVTLWI